MSLSADGNRAYIADTDGDLLILDTSEIQARKANPQAREISRLTWRAASIPQNAIPFTVSGKPYVLEFDEYTQGPPGGQPDEVGAARIIDISDERRPEGRLEPAPPGEPARRPRGGRERPGRQQPGAGLRGALLQRPDPDRPEGRRLLVHRLGAARVRHQRPDQAEGDRLLRAAVAGQAENGFDGSSFAMSQPAFVPSRREVWFSDGASGFYNLRVKDAAWPAAGRPRLPGAPVADRAAQHRPRADRPHARAAAAPRADAAAAHQALVALVREGQQGRRVRRVRSPGTRGAGDDDGGRPRQPQGPARQHRRAVAALVPARQVAERHAVPRQPPQPAPVRRAPGQGAVHRGHLATDDRAAQDAAAYLRLCGV